MRRTRRSAGVAMAVILTIGVPGFNRDAQAQEPPVNPRDNASMRLGIFYLTPSISIDRLGYDDNVLNTEDNREGAFTAAITPRSTIWVPLANRALLTTTASVGFLHFSKFSNQGGVSPSINTLGELYARRVTLFGQVGIASIIGQPTAEFDQRVRRSTSSLGGGLRLAVGSRLSVAASVYRQTLGYDDDAAFLGNNLRAALDHREEGVRLEVRQRMTSLTTVGIVAETRRDRFEFSPERDTDGYRVAAVFALSEKALIAGTAEVGFRHVTPDNPLVPDFDGLVARVAVTNRLPGGFTGGLAWDRDFQYSFQEAQQYYVSNSFSASLRRQVAGAWEATVGAGRNRSTYQAAGVVLGVERRDLTATYTIDIGYRVSRDTRVGFGVSRTRRTSTLPDGRQYATTRAGFSMNHVF